MREFRMLLRFAVGAVLFVALALTLANRASGRASASQGDEFIPEEARLTGCRESYHSEIEFVVGALQLGAGVGGGCLLLGAGCLAFGAARAARGLGWIATGAGLIPSAVFLMDALVLPSDWSEAGIAVVVTGAVSVVGGVAIVLLSDRRISSERRALLAAGRGGGALP